MNKTLVTYIFLVFLLVLSTQALWAQTQTELNYKLLQAAKNNYTDSVKYWLEKGADINFADENGYGALHYAVANFNYSLTSDLLGNNASTKQLKNGYRTPIYTAAILGNLRACYQLKKHGASFDIKDSENHTPHDYALNFGYLRVAKYLKNPDSYSDEPTFYELLKQTIDIYNSHKYHEAYLMLDSTFQCAKIEIAKDHEYFKSIDNWRLLIVDNAFYNSATSNLTDSVKFWLDKGANVDYLDENGNTALLQAIGYYNNELVEYLINKGASVNTRNDITSPPILIAAIKGNLRACYLLWKNGADLSVTDADNKTTAYDYAIQNGYLRVAEFLKNTDSYSEKKYYHELLEQSLLSKQKKQFEDALMYAEEALNGSIEELSRYHENKIFILKHLIGLSAIYIENKNKTLDYYKELLNQLKNLHGENIDYLEALSGYANACVDNDKLEEAEQIFKFLLNDKINVITSNKALHCNILNNEAELNRIKGNYHATESNLLKAIEISKRDSNLVLSYALFCSNIASLYSFLGNYDKAEKYIRVSIDKRKEILGKDSFLYAESINNLADIYQNQFKFKLAMELFIESIEIKKKNIGIKNSSYTTSLGSLANLYSFMNDTNAYALFQEVLKLEKEISGAVNIEQIINRNNLAVYLQKQKRSKEALDIYLENINILKESYKNRSPELFTSYNNLISLYFNDDKQEKSQSIIEEAHRIIRNELFYLFTFLSTNERTHFINTIIVDFHAWKSLLFIIATHKSKETILNIQFSTNSLLLNTSRNIQQSILNSKDSSLISSYEEFKNLRRQINYLQQQPIDKQQGLPELEEKANQLDKQLTKASQVYQQNKENLNIQWQDVQNNLKEGEAAVQFISFPYYNKQWTDSTMYCALIVKPEMEYPAMIPLFEEKQLQALLEGQANPNMLYASRGTKVSYSNTPAKSNGDELYRLIWQPLQSELNEVQTVYFAPSGLLHKVSFSALPVDSTKLLCDQFSLHRLSSTRNIAVQELYEEEPATKQIALFGGIDYDLSNQSWSDNELALTHTESILSRGFSPDSSQRSITFNYLDGTKQEIEKIASIVKRNNEFELQYYTADKATEEAFKKLSNQNLNLIHIATHGFFFPPEHQEDMQRPELQALGEQRFRYVPNPLLRSGLLMAGANRTWKGDYPKDSLEDGVLTAQEISEMNLLNTELVVLSACETGLGDINNSEGVFGLQRAFKLAGVKTLIMSLWKVPDKQTSMLMQAFYTNWLGGMSKYEAFKKAQLSVRETHPEPYYWAGFVMVD